ncbi:MAG: hypothetical protein D6719_06550 [Candidatus Dadabacteria bacterium]|nr:MAG: hypothetical protein D6719_06550 [Candidatus Dadabacteria bacterium]
MGDTGLNKRSLSYLLLTVFLICCLVNCSPRPGDITIEHIDNPEVLSRGRHLVRGLAACGICHATEASPDAVLTGGRQMEDSYGKVVAPNLTPARSGLYGWKAVDIVNVLRLSKKPGGERILSDAHIGYEWLSDNDAYAIAAYLRSLPPIEKYNPRRSVSFFKRNTRGLFKTKREVKGYVPDLNPHNTAAYGAYLVDHVARCGYCHNTPGDLFNDEVYLGGGKTISFNGKSRVAPAITPSEIDGIGAWSKEELVAFLRTGLTPDNKRVDPQFCPVHFFAQASREELNAIAEYLKNTDK